MAGLLNGVGNLVGDLGDAVGDLADPLLRQGRNGNRDGDDETTKTSTAGPLGGGLPAPAPTATTSSDRAADRNSAAETGGVIQISLPNLLPTVPLLAGGSTRSISSATSSASSVSSRATTTSAARQSTTAAPEQSTTTPPAAASPTPTAVSDTIPALPLTTAQAESTTLLAVVSPTSLSVSTSAATSTGDGLGPKSSLAASQGGGFVMDPSKNPTMMALVIAVPIGLALIIGVTVLLFKKGCLGGKRRRNQYVIQDEMEHEAVLKAHAQKFGPSANY